VKTASEELRVASQRDQRASLAKENCILVEKNKASFLVSFSV